MDIRQFRAELAEAFEKVGLERRTIPRRKDPIWLLPGREVERSFSQHAMRRLGAFILSGVLSIDVPAFRAWLTGQFPEDQHGILCNSLLSRHIGYELEVFYEVQDGPPPYSEWANQISRQLAVLPSTIEGLLQAERQEAQALKPFWDQYMAPKAWSYFKAWAAGAAPSSPPPFRLPDGQIVDAAANDPD